MDLSKELSLSQAVLQGNEEEKRANTLLELSAKKYNLQKELERLKLQVSMKQSDLKTLQNNVVTLDADVSVLEKQEGIARSMAYDLTEQYVVKNMETNKLQGTFWNRINGFVSDANRFIAKQELSAKSVVNKTGGEARRERENKFRQLKVESEIEAMHLYEKYQSTKMEELKLIKDLLERESFVI